VRALSMAVNKVRMAQAAEDPRTVETELTPGP